MPFPLEIGDAKPVAERNTAAAEEDELSEVSLDAPTATLHSSMGGRATYLKKGLILIPHLARRCTAQAQGPGL